MKHIYKLIGLLLFCIGCSDSKDNAPVLVQELQIKTDHDGLNLTTEQKLQIEIITLPSDAIDKDEYSYTYLSNDTTVFDVSENGMIEPRGVGEAILNVIATNNTDLWISAVVKVEQHIFTVEDIVLPKEYQECYVDVGNIIDLGSKVSILPENVNNPALVYKSSNEDIAIVNKEGVVETLKSGDVVITISSTDGTNVENNVKVKVREPKYSYLDRTNWVVTTSHEYFKDNAVGGAPELILDGNLKSCLALVKPGKSAGGITVDKDNELYFIVDLSQKTAFNSIKWTHRTDNKSAFLRPNKIDIYGANSLTDFKLIGKDVPIATDIEECELKVKDYLVDYEDDSLIHQYRYIKVVITDWNKSGNTIQIAEFNVGNWEY